MREYGDAIRQLAAANIFPGDMLYKHFGVTRLGRVVFYDYDEIQRMTEMNFRRIPPAPNEEAEMSSEPWYAIGPNDVFPEEFGRFYRRRKGARRLHAPPRRTARTGMVAGLPRARGARQDRGIFPLRYRQATAPPTRRGHHAAAGAASQTRADQNLTGASHVRSHRYRFRRPHAHAGGPAAGSSVRPGCRTNFEQVDEVIMGNVLARPGASPARPARWARACRWAWPAPPSTRSAARA